MNTDLHPLNFLRYLRAALAITFGIGFGASSYAGPTLIHYDANLTTLPLAPTDTMTFGWLTSYPNPINQAPYGTMAPDPLAGGLGQAWQITEPSQGDVNLNYFYGWAPSNLQLSNLAKQNGWTFNTTARYVSNMQGGPSQGLLAFFDDQRYEVTIQFNTAGDLQALLEVAPSQHITKPLTSAAMASNFYNYDLRYNPASDDVSFYFDHELVHTWNGVAATHDPVFRFGTIKSGGAGQMNYSRATVAILDPAPTPTQQGDFNGDGVVNLADYTVWRDSLGSTTQLAADGNDNKRIDSGDYAVWKSNFGDTVRSIGTLSANQTIPEPASIALLLVCMLVARRRAWC